MGLRIPLVDVRHLLLLVLLVSAGSAASNKSSLGGVSWVATTQYEERDLLMKAGETPEESAVTVIDNDEFDGGFSNLDSMLQWAIAMAQPFQVEILSDEDELSPFKFKPKRRRNQEQEISTVVIIDDDFTPVKPNPKLSPTSSFVSETPFKSDVSFSEKSNPVLSTPSFVPETPMSPDSFNTDVSFIKCTAGLSGKPNPMLSASSFVADIPMPPDSFVKCTAGFSDPKIGSSSEKKYSGISGLICLESDNESENDNESERSKKNKDIDSEMENLEIQSRFPDHPSSHGADNLVQAVEDRAIPGECSYGYGDVPQLYSYPTEENTMLGGDRIAVTQKGRGAGNKNNKEEIMERKRKMKEEKARLIEEKKLKREQEKLQKEVLKAEAAEMKKLQKEQQKWETGKFALQSIIAEVDAKVVELGSIGGHILTRFAEKGVTYRVTSNPIERSILWKMTVPEQISKVSSKGPEVSYILLVYEADEFCNLIINETLMDHVSRVQSRFPSYTICYLTNKLKAYINKREQAQYKDPSNNNCWRCPPVEEVLSRLTTEFAGIHSRQCADEAELADHIVGLTSSLANCQFRKKLTRLSINANGALIPKDFVDKNLKKSVWLKALIAIPKVQPRFAVAILKKYPTMRSLLSVYMDPTKSVHEKEFLLKDLKTEGLLGNDYRRVGEVCSKRVYRILMAQNGNIKTEEVEDGADLFRC